MERGKLEGIQEGKTEFEKEIIKNMYKQDMPLEQIASIVKLTVDEIKEKLEII